jgi:hypothetical protein
MMSKGRFMVSRADGLFVDLCDEIGRVIESDLENCLGVHMPSGHNKDRFLVEAFFCNDEETIKFLEERSLTEMVAQLIDDYSHNDKRNTDEEYTSPGKDLEKFKCLAEELCALYQRVQRFVNNSMYRATDAPGP